MMKGSAFLAVAAVVACALVASIAASNYNSGIQDARVRVQSLPSDTSALNNATLPSGNSTVSANSASSSLDVICQGCGAVPNPPITLHSVASAEKALNVTLVLPSSAAVSAEMQSFVEASRSGGSMTVRRLNNGRSAYSTRVTNPSSMAPRRLWTLGQTGLQ